MTRAPAVATGRLERRLVVRHAPSGGSSHSLPPLGFSRRDLPRVTSRAWTGPVDRPGSGPPAQAEPTSDGVTSVGDPTGITAAGRMARTILISLHPKSPRMKS